jgi:hypothetical protein
LKPASRSVVVVSSFGPAVPEAEDVIPGQPAPVDVGGLHGVADQRVPTDDRDPATTSLVRLEGALDGLGGPFVVVAGAGQDDRRDPLGPQHLHIVALADRVTVAVADDQQRAAGDRDLLQPAGDLGEVRVRNVVDDDADRAALGPGQHAGVSVGHVVELGDRFHHPGPQFVGDRLGRGVDDTRRGGRRHPRPAGHVGEGHGAGGLAHGAQSIRPPSRRSEYPTACRVYW